MIDNAVFISAVQQGESATQIHRPPLFQTLPWHSRRQSVEQSSLSYAVGFYRLSIFHRGMCICQSQPPTLSLPASSPLGNHNLALYICFSVLWKRFPCTILFF